jgi:virulence-associated protein VapD/uncharacterized protein (DUF433 family)
MGGKACICGMRVTVGMILGNLSGGESIDELLANYPYLEREDILEAIRYGSWLAQEREIELAPTEAVAIARATFAEKKESLAIAGKPRPIYGIVLQLDAPTLQTVYPGELWEHAYVDVRRFLEANGFAHKQGSLYFGTDVIDPVSCVVTVQRLADAFDWFAAAVRDFRMLRIEDDIDLKPALDLMAKRRAAGRGGAEHGRDKDE